jgi:hypothetical protein
MLFPVVLVVMSSDGSLQGREVLDIRGCVHNGIEKAVVGLLMLGFVVALSTA